MTARRRWAARSILVICIGNPSRSDDGIGRAVAGIIRERVPDGIAVHEVTDCLSDLLVLWSGTKAVVLIDAMSSGSPAGTIQRFDVSEAPLPPGVRCVSTHVWDVSDVIELARALGELPRCVILFGIEGACFDWGFTLSDAVAAARDDVVRQVLAEIATLVRKRKTPAARTRATPSPRNGSDDGAGADQAPRPA